MIFGKAKMATLLRHKNKLEQELEYSEPSADIRKIHKRYDKRLDRVLVQTKWSVLTECGYLKLKKRLDKLKNRQVFWNLKHYISSHV